MAVRMTERDLEALRAGIERQVRDEAASEWIKRTMDRDRSMAYVDQNTVSFRRVDQLKPGDKLVQVSAGEYFKAAEEITSVEFEDRDQRPYTIESRPPNGGTCRRARTGDTLLLVSRA